MASKTPNIELLSFDGKLLVIIGNLQIIVSVLYITEFLILHVCVKITQLYPTLCEPVDCSMSGFSVHGILQARILEWVAFPFSRESSQARDQTQVSCIAGGVFTS